MYFHDILYNVCNYLSMLGSRLNHVSNGGPWNIPLSTPGWLRCWSILTGPLVFEYRIFRGYFDNGKSSMSCKHLCPSRKPIQCTMYYTPCCDMTLPKTQNNNAIMIYLYRRLSHHMPHYSHQREVIANRTFGNQLHCNLNENSTFFNQGNVFGNISIKTAILFPIQGAKELLQMS